MTVYVTAEFTPKDKEMLQEYSTQAASTIAEFGGEFLTKGPIHLLEGKADYQFKAIIAFANKEAAKHWYNSPQYQALISTRTEGMDSNFLLIG